MKRGGWYLVPPALAAAGLAALAAVFAVEMGSFRRAVVAWAARDLESRTALAAATLAEPLATGDFRRLHAFGAECDADGVRLTVLSGPRGLVFDSAARPRDVPDSIYASAPSGEYTVRLGMPLSRVLAPFRRARAALVLAALAGAAGVLAVFLLVYRQRVRIGELRRLEKFRRDFIADFSHEMKTPLAGLVGAADLLGDHPPPETADRLLGMVRREAGRLDALARDILSLARLEAGDRTAEFSRVDLGALLREEAGRAERSAAAAGMAIRVDAPDGTCADCDAALMSQAVSNLLRNAVLRSGGTSVVLSARCDGSEAEIAVEDDGEGVPPECAARLFERFYRADGARSRETGGSGLGLAIVAGIAKRHGGKALFEPAKPRGARFAMRFPARRKRP